MHNKELTLWIGITFFVSPFLVMVTVSESRAKTLAFFGLYAQSFNVEDINSEGTNLSFVLSFIPMMDLGKLKASFSYLVRRIWDANTKVGRQSRE